MKLFGYALAWVLSGAILAFARADDAKVGTLSIQCPVACRIAIPDLGVKGDAPKDKLKLEKVPVGAYTATFSGFNREISHTFSITEGRTTFLTVSIAQGKVREGDPSAPPAGTAAADAAARAAKPRNPLEDPSFKIPDLDLTMVAVQPGMFVMGMPGATKSELPLTRVTISRRYWLSRTEVTQEQWKALTGVNNSKAQGPALPVERVTWEEAMGFCQLLTQRERAAKRLPEGYFYVLPLEAQWEYACRAGGDGNREDELRTLGWYEGNSDHATHPAGSRPVNKWGFQDMRGNVAEWCFDWFGPYPGGNQTDYAGPGEGTLRVVRGGAYDFPAFSCRATSRGSSAPASSHPNVGFRVALVSLPQK